MRADFSGVFVTFTTVSLHQTEFISWAPLDLTVYYSVANDLECLAELLRLVVGQIAENYVV
jgi:hypothetical protein